MSLIERVVTTNKVHELQWKEEGYLRDKRGLFGRGELISKEGVRWVHDNLITFAERL